MCNFNIKFWQKVNLSALCPNRQGRQNEVTTNHNCFTVLPRMYETKSKGRVPIKCRLKG